MKKQWYDITDLDAFINSTRVLVFNNFGNNENYETNFNFIVDINELSKEEKTELNKYLPKEECLVIALDFLKTNKLKNKYKISDISFLKMIESFNTRLVSNMLTKMTSEGILDSAFDSDLNDFVFWVKETDDNSSK